MKDLIEALNRAHQLDESSSEWFTKMKSWLKDTGAEEEEFFWSDYHDYVDDIYGRAIEKVTEDYEHINVEFEFSTQAGRGMCQVFGNDDDGSGEYTWDFRDDRDAVFEFVNESTSVEELFNSLVDYLSGKVDCIQWEDNNDYDDEEDFDEALNRAHELDESLHEGREKTVDEANVKTAVCGVLDAAVNTLGRNISYKLLDITLSKEIRPVEWHAYVKFVPQGDILQRVDTGHLDYRYGKREANDPECAVSLIIPSNVTLDRSSLLDQESKVVKTITDKYELSQARSSRQDDVDKILQSAKAIARKAGLDARWDSSHERHGSLYLRVVYPQEPDIVFDYGGYPERSLYAQHNGLSVYSDATADRSPYVPYYKYSGSNDVTAILDRFRMNVTDVKNNLDELLSKLNTAKENVAYNKNADNINRYIEKVVAQSNIPGLVGHYSKEYNWVTFNSINLKSSVIVEIHPTCKIDDDSMVDETIKRLKNKTYAKLRKAPKKIEV